MATPLPEARRNQSPDEHMQISRRLMEQAAEELEMGDRLQASEKVWGAEQHALAAVGKERGWATEDYYAKSNVALHLSEEFSDSSIRILHRNFNTYHKNYYQNDIDALEIRNAIKEVEQFVNELENIRERGPQPFAITSREQIGRLREIAGNEVANRLKVGKTYTDGFVNRRRLARYQRQWRERENQDSEGNH